MESHNSAFLSEADSDAAFEARRAAEGDKHEPLDGRNAAFLGEADSDDAHEVDFDINPEKHRHNIEDTATSGLHGQQGEHDQESNLKTPFHVPDSSRVTDFVPIILSRTYRSPLCSSGHPARPSS